MVDFTLSSPAATSFGIERLKRGVLRLEVLDPLLESRPVAAGGDLVRQTGGEKVAVARHAGVDGGRRQVVVLRFVGQDLVAGFGLRALDERQAVIGVIDGLVRCARSPADVDGMHHLADGRRTARPRSRWWWMPRCRC